MFGRCRRLEGGLDRSGFDHARIAGIVCPCQFVSRDPAHWLGWNSRAGRFKRRGDVATCGPIAGMAGAMTSVVGARHSHFASRRGCVPMALRGIGPIECAARPSQGIGRARLAFACVASAVHFSLGRFCGAGAIVYRCALLHVGRRAAELTVAGSGKAQGAASLFFGRGRRPWLRSNRRCMVAWRHGRRRQLHERCSYCRAAIFS